MLLKSVMNVELEVPRVVKQNFKIAQEEWEDDYIMWEAIHWLIDASDEQTLSQAPTLSSIACQTLIEVSFLAVDRVLRYFARKLTTFTLSWSTEATRKIYRDTRRLFSFYLYPNK